MFKIVILSAFLILPSIIVFLFIHFITTGNTPPLITPKASRKKLLEIFELNEDSIFYDLGCGNSTFLLELSKKFPNSKFVGIESSVLLYLISKIRVLFSGRKNIDIRFGNFFKHDLSSATHMYSWIFVRDMDKLSEKIKKEFSKDVLIYSLGFTFSNLKPDAVVRLRENKRYGSSLYIYSIKYS